MEDHLTAPRPTSKYVTRGQVKIDLLVAPPPVVSALCAPRMKVHGQGWKGR